MSAFIGRHWQRGYCARAAPCPRRTRATPHRERLGKGWARATKLAGSKPASTSSLLLARSHEIFLPGTAFSSHAKNIWPQSNLLPPSQPSQIIQEDGERQIWVFVFFTHARATGQGTYCAAQGESTPFTRSIFLLTLVQCFLSSIRRLSESSGITAPGPAVR